MDKDGLITGKDFEKFWDAFYERSTDSDGQESWNYEKAGSISVSAEFFRAWDAHKVVLKDKRLKKRQKKSKQPRNEPK